MKDPVELVTGDMPEPQEHAIEAEAGDLKREAERTQELLDREGLRFDPKIHKRNKDGSPVINADGTLRRISGRGSVKHKAKAEQSRLEVPEAIGAAGADARKTGIAIAESIITLGLIVGGQEWQPQVKPEYGLDERQNLYEAWARYCEAQEIREVPPGLAVSMATIAYAVPRFTMPQTQGRMQKAKEWLGEKVGAWRGKRLARSATSTPAQGNVS